MIWYMKNLYAENQKRALWSFLTIHPCRSPCGHFWTSGPSSLLSEQDTAFPSLHTSLWPIYTVCDDKIQGLGALHPGDWMPRCTKKQHMLCLVLKKEASNTQLAIFPLGKTKKERKKKQNKVGGISVFTLQLSRFIWEKENAARGSLEKNTSLHLENIQKYINKCIKCDAIKAMKLTLLLGTC